MFIFSPAVKKMILLSLHSCYYVLHYILLNLCSAGDQIQGVLNVGQTSFPLSSISSPDFSCWYLLYLNKYFYFNIENQIGMITGLQSTRKSVLMKNKEKQKLVTCSIYKKFPNLCLRSKFMME